MNRKLPRWAFGPDREGLLDPDKITAEERATLSPETLAAEYERRTSTSPVIRRFQQLTDRALGRGKR